jgi:hypothetical protein
MARKAGIDFRVVVVLGALGLMMGWEFFSAVLS